MSTTASRRTRWAGGSGPSRSEAVIYLRVSTKEQAERGGEVEGFSIPAQREACIRRATELGLPVAREFIDAGESARSADRPKLQKMLLYLAEHPTKTVIVHKIDRLARNRADDVQITLAIQSSGANLVSVTENIDETPQGKLMHTIFSGLAAFYSDNLATEVIKGTEQKVKAGGTPSMAPIGYLNVRTVVNGRENRTIEIDAGRAPHVIWAFTVYATGDWSLNRLAHELEVRGLLTRPTATRPAKPVPAKILQTMLRNPYYMGVVTWRGLEHDGKHPKLVSPELFEQVQNVLTAHRQSGERSYRRKHYLAGTVYCDLCQSKLIYMLSKGRAGAHYGYWACMGRHTYKNGCELPYLADEVVEDLLIEQWQHERLADHELTQLRAGLLADLADFTKTTAAEAERLDLRIESIRRDRRKWAEKAMDGTVPDDIARDKQGELGRQLATAETQRAALRTTTGRHEQIIEHATGLLANCGSAYARASDSIRRDYNQAWFDKVFFTIEDGQPTIGSVARTELFEAMTTARVEIGQPAPASVFEPVLYSDHNEGDAGEAGQNGKTGSFRYRVISLVRGSNVACLVGADGFEPPTARV